MSNLKSNNKFKHINVKEDLEFQKIINDENLIQKICKISEENLLKLKDSVNNSESDKEKKEILQLYLGFVYLKQKENTLMREQENLLKQIDNIEQGNVQFFSSTNQSSYKKKRIRKKKTDIERHYKCLSKTCPKAYGSENSMNQHMKIKHPEFWNDLKNQEMRIFKSETIYFDETQQKQKDLTDINNDVDNNVKESESINFYIEQ